MEVKNGDFVTYLAQAAKPRIASEAASSDPARLPSATDEPKFFDGEAFAEMLMDEEKLEAYAAKMRAEAEEKAELEPMSDEEFERQALEAGGSDNNPETPE
jgi:hypothetical protein